MTDLDDFMNATAPEGKSSKLIRHLDDISLLKNKGYSEPQIMQYLYEKKGVQVSRPTLNRFVRKYINKLNLPSSVSKSDENAANKTGRQDTDRTVKTTDNSASGKFDWQRKFTKEELLGSDSPENKSA